MVTAASSAANPRAAIAAYDKAGERLRPGILGASKLFPDTDALLTWLLKSPMPSRRSKIASTWRLRSER
jgi:hypothetical protein